MSPTKGIVSLLFETGSAYWKAALVYGLIALLTYIAYRLFIRPFIHPLRKVPGLKYHPLLGNVKQFANKSGELNFAGLERILKEHGQLVRVYFPLGRAVLVTTNPDIMKHVLVMNSKNYIKPRITLIRVFEKVIGKGLVLLEGADHATHKRLISPAFNNASIKKMIPVFEEAGNKLTKHWLKELQGVEGKVVVPVQNDLSHTTLDVIGKTAFGYEFNSLENPSEPVNVAFQEILEAKDISFLMASLPYYYELPFSDSIRARKAVNTMHKKVLDIINYKTNLLKTEKDTSKITGDILGKMMLARDEETGEGLTNTELKNEVTTIMSAGHETTSTGMAWFLLVMAQMPEIQAKVREEILHHLPSPDTPITWEVLESMTYLENAIKETLRIHPPVPTTIRSSLEDDYITFNGTTYHLPPDSHIMLAIAPMMKLPEHFEDPETFRPERFEESEQEAKNMYKFLPFLIGPRMCVGYKFAMLEMKAILVCLLRQLHFEMVPGSKFVGSYRNRITQRPDPPLELYVSLPREM